MNIFTSPIYFVLVYFTLPVGTMLGEEFIKFSCNFYVCLNIGYPDVPYKVIYYVTNLEFVFIILPIWILICVFWFFVMEYLLKKAKEKKLIPFLLKSFAVLILILFLGWLFYLDFKVSIFYIEYKNKLRKGPPFTKMLYQENTIMGPTLHP